MPKQKLTLSVDADIIEHARQFSQQTDTSISALVSRFLESLHHPGHKPTPIAARLRGVLPPSASRKEYRDHLLAKHQ